MSRSCLSISIHALVKRATVIQNDNVLNTLYFNPRPREEGDQDYTLNRDVPYNFNPRPREEGDILPIVFSMPVNDFNPRPREEGDPSLNRT